MCTNNRGKCILFYKKSKSVERKKFIYYVLSECLLQTNSSFMLSTLYFSIFSKMTDYLYIIKPVPVYNN